MLGSAGTTHTGFALMQGIGNSQIGGEKSQAGACIAPEEYF